MSRRSTVASHTKTLSVVDEEALPVNEFGRMMACPLVTPPRLPVARRQAGKHLALLRQSTTGIHGAREGPGPVPLAGMILPPSPPESPSVFALNVQTPTRYIACQPLRAETPPYSDEDEDDLPSTTECPAAFFASALTSSPRPLSPVPAAADFRPTAVAPAQLPVAGLSIRRTSSPPTLEQITQRLRKTTVAGTPARRNSEPPVSSPPSRSSVTRLPTLAVAAPVRAETLPSRLPTFLLNRARTQPAAGAAARNIVPGRPSSSPAAFSEPLRVGSAVRPPRMVIQEIPTFKLTPPPNEREERALALRLRLASASARVERRRSTGGELRDVRAEGGLRVPGL